MTKTEFQTLQRATFARIEELTATKGEEYSRDADQLANFKRAGAEAGIQSEQAWLVFFNKHIDSIKTWIRGGTITEGIEGRIDDAILYLILLKAITRENATMCARTTCDQDCSAGVCVRRGQDARPE